MTMITLEAPHANQPLLAAGPAPEDAAATLIMLHGRGAGAHDILGLYPALALPGLAALAPHAANSTWYPQSFLAPLDSNQPYLDSALRRIDSLVTDLLARGIGSHRIALLGFSQGACLASESICRHPRRYGAVMALTGGVIGPAGTPRNYPGSLNGTPVFLGTSDPDPYIPYERVEETKTILTQMGAQVELRRYPGMPHTISDDEIDVCRALLTRLISTQDSSPQ